MTSPPPLRRRPILQLVVAGLACASCTAEPAASTSTGTPPASSNAAPVKVTVAAASDLKFAFDEIVAAFEKVHPEIDVEPTYGSSGNFFSQLSNKAPFDLFLSADISYPQKLAEAGLALKETEFEYAIGQLVLWTRKDSGLDVQKGFELLKDPAVRKIAIANPKHAPYGRAAEAALKHAGVYDQVQDRLVLGENVAQTAQFVETGAADVGIFAHSLALAPALADKGVSWPVPSDSHPPLVQGGILLQWVKDRPAAEALRSFLLSDEGRTILGRHGFIPAEH